MRLREDPREIVLQEAKLTLVENGHSFEVTTRGLQNRSRERVLYSPPLDPRDSICACAGYMTASSERIYYGFRANPETFPATGPGNRRAQAFSNSRYAQEFAGERFDGQWQSRGTWISWKVLEGGDGEDLAKTLLGILIAE
jgi:hypothetical protein